MPIVLSYEDIDALGTLSVQAGKAQTGYSVQFGPTADQVQAQQQAQQAADFRERQLESQQAAQAASLEQRRTEAQNLEDRTAATAEAAQKRFEAEQAARIERERIERLHQNQLEAYKAGQMRLREQERGAGKVGPAAVGPDGTPNLQQAKAWVQQGAQHLPGPSRSYQTGQPQIFVDTFGNTQDQALAIAQMPTHVLQDYLAQQPNSPMAQFVAFVLKQRQLAVQHRGGASPEVAPRTTSTVVPGMQQALGGVQQLFAPQMGSTDNMYLNKSTDELLREANRRP